MKVPLLFNPEAGQLKDDGKTGVPEELFSILREGGIDIEPQAVAGPDFVEAVKAAARTRPPAIIVGGGDGTVSGSAGCLVDTSIPLGVLPLGTLNHFARDVGLSAEWREAARRLTLATPARVDIAEVNRRVFVNNCSIGSYPEAVRRREALREGGRGKWLAMALAVFRVFRELRRFRFDLRLDGQASRLRSPFLVVSNNRYSGRLLDENQRTRMNEGVLGVYSTRAHRHGALIRMAWQALWNRFDRVEALDARAGAEATVEIQQPGQPIAIDGEVVSMTFPLEFRIRPGALTILAPPPSPAPS